MDAPSRLYRFALAETDLQQLAQFGFLIVSADNVLGQVELAIMIYFGGEATVQVLGLGVGEVCHELGTVGWDCWFSPLHK